MKKIILLAFVCITGILKAQTTKPIDGFLGIKFGSNEQQVEDIVKAKGGTLNDGKTPESASFSGISLGNRKVSTLFVHFVEGKAYEAVFVFRPNVESKSVEYYNDLVKDLSDIYGAGKESKQFKPPYLEGDGYETTAIKTGNADYQTIWHDGANILATKIYSDKTAISVRLYYDDGSLRKVKDDQQKAKNKSDF